MNNQITEASSHEHVIGTDGLCKTCREPGAANKLYLKMKQQAYDAHQMILKAEALDRIEGYIKDGSLITTSQVLAMIDSIRTDIKNELGERP